MITKILNNKGYHYFLASFLGALSVLAFVPYGYSFVMAVSLSGIIFLTLEAKPKKAFYLGWLFGFFHFCFGVYWIMNALMKDENIPLVMLPLALGGLSALLACYPALACFATSFFKDTLAKTIAFASLWTLSEWLRSWLLTGFPWNPLGSIWVVRDETIQLASVVGVYGLSFFTALAAACSWLLFKLSLKYLKINFKHFTLFRFLIASALPFYILYLLLYLFGWIKIANNPREFFNNSNIRLVQPNIAQELKWDNDILEDNFLTHLRMNLSKGAEKNTAFIWGETASPYFLDIDLFNKRRATQTLPNNSLLITGMLRKDGNKYYNSLVVISKDGSILGVYDKTHLVPFGEYIPLKKWLPLNKVTAGYTDLSKGEGLKVINPEILPPFTPIICYEIIFSGRIKPKNQRPDWFLNITNDGWYGKTSGPYQHFAKARIRAVEEGIPVVRVANTGISAIIDSLGKIVDHIDLDEKNILDATLPKPLAKPTFFSRFGNQIPVFFALFFLLLSIVANKKTLIKI